jgi:hypothetical protein
VIDGILGIDVSKNTLDVSISSCGKVRTKAGTFGWWGAFIVRSFESG